MKVEEAKKFLFGGARGGRNWRPGMIQPVVPGREQRLVATVMGEEMFEFPAAFGHQSGDTGNRTATGAAMMLAQQANHMAEEIPLPALSRVMVMVPDELDARQREAIEEETLLGYSAYRKALGLPGPLARTLAALEIQHVDTDSVVKYKVAMMNRERQKFINRRDMFCDMKSCEVLDLGSANEEPSMVSSMFMAFDTGSDRMSLRRHESVTVVRWACTSLRGYEQPVPDFARSKALQIARAVPEVEFFVEELRRDKVVIDPFLIAKLGDEQFYIEVWGEPEFEAKMEHNQV